MTTDIRGHRLHSLEVVGLKGHNGNEALVYCRTCDLFMTNLHKADIVIGKVTTKLREGASQ